LYCLEITNDTFKNHLCEVRVHYKCDFTVKNIDLRVENAYFWKDNS
jgi:hypothetical protein